MIRAQCVELRKSDAISGACTPYEREDDTRATRSEGVGVAPGRGRADGRGWGQKGGGGLSSSLPHARLYPHLSGLASEFFTARIFGPTWRRICRTG